MALPVIAGLLRGILTRAGVAAIARSAAGPAASAGGARASIRGLSHKARRKAIKRRARRISRLRKPKFSFGARIKNLVNAFTGNRSGSTSSAAMGAMRSAAGYLSRPSGSTSETSSQNRMAQISGSGDGFDTSAAQAQVDGFASKLKQFALVATLGTSSLIQFGAALVKSIHVLGSAQIDTQRGTAQLNGPMAMAVAQLDVHRLSREMKQGRLTNESFTRLTGAINKLEDAMSPYRAGFTNTLNNLFAVLAKLATSGTNMFTSVIETAGPILRGAMQVLIPPFGAMAAQIVKGFEDAAKAVKAEQDKQDKATTQNMQDGFDLLNAMVAANRARAPAPNIPKQPVKGKKQ